MAMTRQRSRIFDYAVYLAIRSLICLFQCLSNSLARSLVNGVALLAYFLDRKHWLLARANLGNAFPGRYSASELDALVLAMYRHFLTLLVEISQLHRRLRRHNAKFYLDMGPDEATICDMLRSDRPLLMVSGHFGNWELAGCGFGALGFKTYALARPLDNPYLEVFLRRFREHRGQRILDKNGDLTLLKDTLARGGKIAVLADQRAGPRGLQVSFFGRTASTHKGVAVLSLQYRAPILVLGCRKFAEPMRYQLFVEDIIYPEDYAGSRSDAVRRITQRHTAALERIIKTAPEQYFWLHNRWKHQPVNVNTPRLPLAA
jgi:KDO2-lipid IV(A) lauroyltransferase